MLKVEYRVRPVTRYIITKYTEHDDGRACSETIGMYENDVVADRLVQILKEHDELKQRTE